MSRAQSKPGDNDFIASTGFSIACQLARASMMVTGNTYNTATSELIQPSSKNTVPPLHRSGF